MQKKMHQNSPRLTGKSRGPRRSPCQCYSRA